MFISRPKPLLFKGDHRYPSSNPESPVVIFYSEIGHEEFSNIHYQLKSKSKEGKINYVFRHYISVSIDLFYNFLNINLFKMTLEHELILFLLKI